MTKPRLVVPLTIQFGVRYLLRTRLLPRLLDEGIQPVVLLGWNDPTLRDEMVAMGLEVADLPPTTFGPSYTRIRRQIDTWHFERMASPTTPIARRRMNIDLPRRTRWIKELRELRNRAILHLPGRVDQLRADEQRLLTSDTNIAAFTKVLRDTRADGILSLTPFHKQEELVGRAAELAGLKTCAAILSFDNLTVWGWIPTKFDSYLLWNRHNAEQLRRGYPEVRGKRIDVVGAPQFDFYRDPAFVWDEATWREKMGLPAGRPVILYGGGPPSIVPHEPHLVTQLDDAIERGQIPGKPVLLLRRHPADLRDRWVTALQGAKHVVFDEPWPTGEKPKHSNIRDADIAKLASTLKHSAVHVNVASTMAVDGAVFDRPQVGPAYDDRPGRRYDRMMRELYEHEHFLPIVRSGGLAIVRDRTAMVRAVCDGLARPAERAAGRRAMVDEIITFTDGKATDRVLAGLRRLMSGADVAERPERLGAQGL